MRPAASTVRMSDSGTARRQHASKVLICQEFIGCFPCWFLSKRADRKAVPRKMSGRAANPADRSPASPMVSGQCCRVASQHLIARRRHHQLPVTPRPPPQVGDADDGVARGRAAAQRAQSDCDPGGGQSVLQPAGDALQFRVGIGGAWYRSVPRDCVNTEAAPSPFTGETVVGRTAGTSGKAKWGDAVCVWLYISITQKYMKAILSWTKPILMFQMAP